MVFEFVSIHEKRPPYGAPVLLKAGGVVQHITYMLNGEDETPDWFEPYHFAHDDELTLWWYQVDGWALLPDWKG